MDLHIILIILIVLILVILVAHGLWSSRREKSQMFKSANTFTYDSRTEGQDLLDRVPGTGTTASVIQNQNMQDEISAATSENAAPPQAQTVAQPPQPQVSVEQAVNNIRITLPPQAAAQYNEVEQASSAVSAESLSRSALLNRTIADLEQELDSEEGINTSSDILREELARATQQSHVNVSQSITDTPSTPTTAAENIRTRLNPEQHIRQPLSDTMATETVSAPTTAAESIRASLNPDPQTRQPQSDTEQTPTVTAEKPQTLVLYVVAPNGQSFAGTQIIQSLESLGFLFGQHSLYHRHLDLDGNSPILFSAANMMNPGIFDLNNIADFRSVGLVLFMHLPSPGSDLANFRLLLRAAQTLAEQLNGQVLDDKRQPFNEQSKNHYLSLIS
ncbi:hypothetical protein OA57_10430 [Chelonobacter oris]|uniref:Cell division protein ZipA n=2 Tax=Chelonobacter oris TaxID=505317 RepID=A0A0A3B7Y4_9PAST|nr:hypothetical protein OA57_10430 [Chelonobacter oris]